MRRVFLVVALTAGVVGGEPLTEIQVRDGLEKAVGFFRGKVAVHGGYVWRCSADLRLREGEGKTDLQTAWAQPPGTPTVGLALLDAWKASGSETCRDGALEAARALLSVQLHSGGWTNRMEFDPVERKRYAYMLDGEPGKKARNYSTLDDNTTQSALLFLMRLDAALDFADSDIHNATLRGLESVLKAQFANGGWPQVYDGPADRETYPSVKARFPEKWSRTYTGHNNYWRHPTTNDGLFEDLLPVLFEAAVVYRDKRYHEAALAGGEFLLRAQLPLPQPGWAQQYNERMEPVWARKFEPPAVTGGEARGILETLMVLYERTKDPRWLEPLPVALDYYESCRLPDGRLARFYEMGTNKPLFFDREYALTYGDDDLPTHYAFKVNDWTTGVRKRFERWKQVEFSKVETKTERRPDGDAVAALLMAMDERGAWVESGRLRYHGKDDSTSAVLSSATFSENIRTLAAWLR